MFLPSIKMIHGRSGFCVTILLSESVPRCRLQHFSVPGALFVTFSVPHALF